MENPTSTPIRVGYNFDHPVSEVHAYFPVNSVHPIVTRWQSVREKVLDLLKELPWAVLSVVSYSHLAPVENEYTKDGALIVHGFEGYPGPQQQPLVLIGAPIESQSSWQTLAERIYSLCREADLSEVRVLIESVPFPLTSATPLDPSKASIFSYQEHVPMGSSFGPDGSSASLGGTVTLSDGSSLLLSVFDAFSDVITEDQLQKGRYPGSVPPGNPRIPSNKDTAFEKKLLEDYIKDLEKTITKSKYGLSNAELETSLEPKKLEQLHRLETMLTDSKRNHEELKDGTSGDKGLGVLRYGSGYARGHDWSLSSFQNRRMDNSLPVWDSLENAMQMINFDAQEYNTTKIRYGLAPSTVLEFSKPDINGVVFKQGRSSALTIGRINALESDLLVGKHVNLEKVVNFRMQASFRLQGRELVIPGDSGAWVMNMDGSWVGSIIGQQGPDIALLMDAERVVADIEAHTNLKVVYPTRSGI